MALVSKVRADYEQLTAIAQAFGLQAETAQRVLGALQKDVGALQGGDWMGKGSEAFYAEMNAAVLPSMERLVSALNEAASTTRKVSQIMKQAEDDSAALFRLDDLAASTGGSGRDASGSTASGGESAETEPDSKDDGNIGPGVFGLIPEDVRVIDNQALEIQIKLKKEQYVELDRFTKKVNDRLKLAEQIAALKGTPEYDVRRAEFAIHEEKWLSGMEREIEQSKAYLAVMTAAYEAAEKSIASKRFEDKTVEEMVAVKALRLRADITRQKILFMERMQMNYFKKRPELPRP